MRKPRDFDAALKTLTEKTKALKESKCRQLGDLIVATGADTLDIDTLAGVLIATVQSTDIAQKKLWKKQGEEFFRKAKTIKSGDANHHEGTQQDSPRPTQARSTTSQT